MSQSPLARRVQSPTSTPAQRAESGLQSPWTVPLPGSPWQVVPLPSSPSPALRTHSELPLPDARSPISFEPTVGPAFPLVPTFDPIPLDAAAAGDGDGPPGDDSVADAELIRTETPDDTPFQSPRWDPRSRTCPRAGFQIAREEKKERQRRWAVWLAYQQDWDFLLAELDEGEDVAQLLDDIPWPVYPNPRPAAEGAIPELNLMQVAAFFLRIPVPYTENILTRHELKDTILPQESARWNRLVTAENFWVALREMKRADIAHNLDVMKHILFQIPGEWWPYNLLFHAAFLREPRSVSDAPWSAMPHEKNRAPCESSVEQFFVTFEESPGVDLEQELRRWEWYCSEVIRYSAFCLANPVMELGTTRVITVLKNMLEPLFEWRKKTAEVLEANARVQRLLYRSYEATQRPRQARCECAGPSASLDGADYSRWGLEVAYGTCEKCEGQIVSVRPHWRR